MNSPRLLLGLICLLAISWSGVGHAADTELQAAIEKRLVRLKRTDAARQELVTERNKVNSQLQALAQQLVQAQQFAVAANQQAALAAANFLQLQNQHAGLEAQAAALAQSRTATGDQLTLLSRQIQATRTQINTANVSVTQFNLASQQATQRAQVLDVQAGGVQRTLQAILKKVVEQQLDYLDHADPFFKLSRAEQEAALAVFNEWLKADPQNWGARIARAFAMRKLEKIDDALADLTAVVESNSSLTPIALAARGELQTSRGNERDGLADLGQAYKLDRKDPRIYLFRGLAHLRDNKFQAGEADFKNAARANKDDPEPFRLAALLYSTAEIPGARDAKRALDCATKACDLTKFSDWSCLDALAAAHAESADYDEAARTAREAAELTFGENRELCFQRARLYESRMPLRLKWK